jgi:FtsP/CotA-like multicopper oxidase with cupredoxin domain
MLTRRQFVIGVAGTVTTAALVAGASEQPPVYRRLPGAPAQARAGKTVTARFVAAERPTSLPCFAGRSLPMWTFTNGDWPPVIRLELGDQLEATLENRLPRGGELTSIHWHGIRLPNDQDGVPYLVQPPVRPGESFVYRFTPPDTGTYFFHTHCNTVEQLGRGLMGILLIDGDTTEPYDADKVLLIRDWAIDVDSGEFTSFFTLRGAGRAGTYGSLRSVNGAVNPEIALPAAGDCRLRLINSDPTRIVRVHIEGAEAAVIAIDGIAVAPFALAAISMGPAMRIDLVLRAPREGGVARLLDDSTGTPVQLAHFTGRGSACRTGDFDPAPLRATSIPEPDLANARRLTFTFDASDVGQFISALLDSPLGTSIDALCLSSRIFWTINGRPWPDRDHAIVPPPLAVLDRGCSYLFTLKNASPFLHPIHIHGHTFKVVHSSRQHLPVHHADTVLLLPEEEIEVAFVADNPGDWMLHCHVIEHQESGMMGYFRVA